VFVRNEVERARRRARTKNFCVVMRIRRTIMRRQNNIGKTRISCNARAAHSRVSQKFFISRAKNFECTCGSFTSNAHQKLFSQAARFAACANPESIKNERISDK
jgi:hypothetical protein